MAFDPSVISQIPDSGPDPVAAQEKAYKLADLIDTDQMNKLRLNQEKQNQADQSKARDILKTATYSTPDGVMKTAEKLTQAGMPGEAMKFMQTAQSYQSGEIEQQRQKLELAATQQDAIAGTLDNVYGQLEQLRAQGATPAMLDAAAVKLVIPAMRNLAQQNPQLAPVVQKFAQNPQNLTYNGIRSAEAASNRGQAMLKSRLEELKANTAEKTEKERERHDQATEENASKRTAQSSGGFDGRSGELMAALAERGVSLPAGFRSKSQQQAMLEGLLARNPNKTADEIADQIKTGQIEFGAEKKETQTAAATVGKVEVAENEINEFVPLVRDASAKVPRGRFVPINKLMQAVDSSISDPNLKALRIRINSVLNAYDMLAARGGTDKDKRAEVRSLITSADSPEALEAGLRSFELEAQAAHRAAVKATRVPELKPSSGDSGGWKIEPVQ